MNRLVLLLTIVATALLAACGTLNIQADVVPVGTDDAIDKTPLALGDGLDEPAQATEGEVIADPADEPAAAEDPAVLPAPLYYLNAADGQVWRVEADGVTTTQVTSAEDGVSEFSVSPASTHVAYVSGNDLYLMGAPGDEPQIVVDGAEMPAPEEVDMEFSAFEQITRPRLSPDGSKLAYGQGGVNIYQLSTGETRQALPSDPIPGLDEAVEVPPRMYMPERWSPDGSRMIVTSGVYYSEGGFSHVLDLASGALTDLTLEDGLACCQWAWSQDGSAVFVANDQPGMIESGLWRADAQTGQYSTLVNGFRGDNLTVFGAPYDPANGQIYGFMASGPFDELMSTPLIRVSMSAIPQDGADEGQALRSDSYMQGEAAWAPDGSGAAIVDVTENAEAWPRIGPLRWLSLDGSAAVELPAEGHMLAWGAGS